jgi:hypothetical protein
MMFFLHSKSVAFLLLPSNILIGVAAVGAVLLATAKKRAGIGLLLASIILLAIAGWWPTGNLLIHALESRFPQWDTSRGAPDGVVVLGGAIESRLSREFGEPAIGGDGNRIVALGKLARTYPGARIIYPEAIRASSVISRRKRSSSIRCLIISAYRAVASCWSRAPATPLKMLLLQKRLRTREGASAGSS